ncbi:hypothetical protein NLO76_18565, partial [Escherichia coli]|nr:hypothetical protein [Escherichia coli]
LVYCKMSVGSTHHLEVVFVWKQNYILVDEYFFFCCTWIVNSAEIKMSIPLPRILVRLTVSVSLSLMKPRAKIGDYVMVLQKITEKGGNIG